MILIIKKLTSNNLGSKLFKLFVQVFINYSSQFSYGALGNLRFLPKDKLYLNNLKYKIEYSFFLNLSQNKGFQNMIESSFCSGISNIYIST